MDLAHAKQDLHACEVAVIPGEYNQRRVPCCSIYQRHEIVVARLVVRYRGQVRPFLPIAAYEDGSRNEFDAAEPAGRVLRVILPEHPARFAVSPSETARGKRNAPVQISGTQVDIGRVPATEETGIEALGQARDGLLALIVIAGELPRTAPLHAHRRQQNSLHAHSIHRCQPECGFGNFVGRIGHALKQDQALRFRGAVFQLEEQEPDGDACALPSNRALNFREVRVHVRQRDGYFGDRVHTQIRCRLHLEQVVPQDPWRIDRAVDRQGVRAPSLDLAVAQCAIE